MAKTKTAHPYVPARTYKSAHIITYSPTIFLRIVTVFILTNFATLLCGDSQKVFAGGISSEKTKLKALERLRPEKFNFKIGGGYPFTWNSSFEYTIDPSGVRIGALAQGPHDPYNPEIPNAKPSITTYGVSLGWAYPTWCSKFKGTGAYWYFGTGSTKNDIKFHYNYGFVIQTVVTVFQKKNYVFGVFAQYKKMYQVINKEQNGLTWKTSDENLNNFNFGATILL